MCPPPFFFSLKIPPFLYQNFSQKSETKSFFSKKREEKYTFKNLKNPKVSKPKITNRDFETNLKWVGQHHYEIVCPVVLVKQLHRLADGHSGPKAIVDRDPLNRKKLFPGSKHSDDPQSSLRLLPRYRLYNIDRHTHSVFDWYTVDDDSTDRPDTLPGQPEPDQRFAPKFRSDDFPPCNPNKTPIPIS